MNFHAIPTSSAMGKFVKTFSLKNIYECMPTLQAFYSWIFFICRYNIGLYVRKRSHYVPIFSPRFESGQGENLIALQNNGIFPRHIFPFRICENLFLDVHQVTPRNAGELNLNGRGSNLKKLQIGRGIVVFRDDTICFIVPSIFRQFFILRRFY